MRFEMLPQRTGLASRNMATDLMMLEQYPTPDASRWRHYGWQAAAFTFGYRQNLAEVTAELAPHLPGAELCRRPTGGGIVDHRCDWTYTFVVPRSHPLARSQSSESYRAVHQVLADALQCLGCDAQLQAVAEEVTGGPAVCFRRAERFDVVHSSSGFKLAGAAQKRNKHGLLLQGSVSRLALPASDWEAFGRIFPRALACLLDSIPYPVDWPLDWTLGMDSLSYRFGSWEWNAAR